jgi:translation initiation factor 3 subunit A
LHEALENTFAPRKLAGTVAPLLKELKEATPRLAHYAEPLARVAVSRVVAQLGRVYSVVTLDNFEQLVAPLAVPADDVEKLIVGAAGGPGGGASSGGALARVDHRLGVLRFPEEPQAAPASRHLGDLARYVAEAAQAARDHKPEEMRDPERAAKRARLFDMARAASARDHESALERKQVIERRKEEQERLMAEKKAAEVGRGVLCLSFGLSFGQERCVGATACAPSARPITRATTPSTRRLTGTRLSPFGFHTGRGRKKIGS